MLRSSSIPHAPLLVFFLLLLPSVDGLQAQPLSQARTGPVIDDYGPVYDVPSPDFATPLGPSRVVFEVAEGAPDAGQLNTRLETVARYLNMHARAGRPVGAMQVALVVHGSAGKDLLGLEGFRERYAVENPNYDLIQQLIGAGVQVVLCGQTQTHRGVARDELAPGVEVALSAMTALVALQSRGYIVIAF